MNNFRRYKTALVFGLVVILGGYLLSCDEIAVGNDFLEQPPSIDYTKDSVFTSAQGAKELLWNTYATLPYGLSSWSRRGNLHLRNAINRRGTLVALTDIASDAASWSTVSVEWYSGNINPTSWWRVFKYKFVDGLHWKAFFQGWTLVENIDRVPDMDQAEKEQLKAEAKTIMALHYVDMYRNIGGVPWINHAYRPDEELKVQRLTAQASVDSIVALLDEAIPHLPAELNVAQEKGRMAKAAAAGLKTRLLLFAASPLFNSSQPYMNGEAADKEIVWMGGYKPELWREAANAAKEAIDIIENSSYYGLEMPASQDSVGYREAYRSGYLDRGSGEVLISTRVGLQHPAPWDIHWYVINSFSWSQMDGPTHTYAQMFGDENGVPLDQSTTYDMSNPYVNRDPRFYETLTSNGSMWGNRPAEMWIGGRERLSENYGNAFGGYRIRKFVFNTTKILQDNHHWPYLRVPEIYLSYAEALNEANGGPTAEAFEYVNKVRNRVGLTNLQNIMNNPSNQEEFRELVIRERVLEMGFENIRWFDMVRWKRKNIFQKELKGLNVYRENDGSFRYEEYSISDKYPRTWKQNFSPKWYLDPINNSEVNKEYGVIQNPGWELSGN